MPYWRVRSSEAPLYFVLTLLFADGQKRETQCAVEIGFCLDLFSSIFIFTVRRVSGTMSREKKKTKYWHCASAMVPIG